MHILNPAHMYMQPNITPTSLQVIELDYLKLLNITLASFLKPSIPTRKNLSDAYGVKKVHVV